MGQDTISGHLEAFWEKYTKIWDLARFGGGKKIPKSLIKIENFQIFQLAVARLEKI